MGLSRHVWNRITSCFVLLSISSVIYISPIYVQGISPFNLNLMINYLTGTKFSWGIFFISFFWALLWKSKLGRKTSFLKRNQTTLTTEPMVNFRVYYLVTTTITFLIVVFFPSLSTRLYKEYHFYLGSSFVFGTLFSISYHVGILLKTILCSPNQDESFNKGMLLEKDIKHFVFYWYGITFLQCFLSIFYYQTLLWNGFNIPALINFLLLTLYLLRAVSQAEVQGSYRGLDFKLEKLGFCLSWISLGCFQSLCLSEMQRLIERPSEISAINSLLIGSIGAGWLVLLEIVDYKKKMFLKQYHTLLGLGAIGTKNVTFLRVGLPSYIPARDMGNLDSQQEPILIAGLWSLVRHPDSTLEIYFFLFWTLASLGWSLLPLLLPTLLAMLHYQRLLQEEKYSLGRYGKYWNEYTSKVPYKLLPGLF